VVAPNGIVIAAKRTAANTTANHTVSRPTSHLTIGGPKLHSFPIRKLPTHQRHFKAHFIGLIKKALVPILGTLVWTYDTALRQDTTLMLGRGPGSAGF
jgi:hypothetical protein